MIITKTILFSLALIFTIRFLSDFILRLIGQLKRHKTDDEWHDNYTKGYIQILPFAKNLSLMIATWTCFYLMYQI